MVRRCFHLLWLFSLPVLGGCATTTSGNNEPTAATVDPFLAARPQAVTLAAFDESPLNQPAPTIALALQHLPPVDPEPSDSLPAPTDNSLIAGGVLDMKLLVAEVLARNPSVEAMIAAWQAAAARYPQEVALEDPMFDSAVGPDSWGEPEFSSAYMVMASQKFPWPGKRRLRGRIACFEAAAAASDVDALRLELAETAKLAYLEYYTAHRQLALNDDNGRQLRQYRDSATARLRAGTAEQQDVLLSEVELAMLDAERNRLERQVRVAAARINTLLARSPDEPLPPPAAELPEPGAISTEGELRAIALGERPDVAKLAAEIQAEQAAVALACKEFYPDPELYFKYDAFWQEEPLRTAVGMNVNLPLYRSKRWAAVREARANLQRRRAELAALETEINNDVAEAYARLVESRRTLELFRDQILPAAQRSVDSAQAGYVAGNVEFLRLIDARRQLIALRNQEVEAASDYHRSLAELERAVGREIDD